MVEFESEINYSDLELSNREDRIKLLKVLMSGKLTNDEVGVLVSRLEKAWRQFGEVSVSQLDTSIMFQ